VKSKVYIETSIPSYLAARRSQDVRVLANQETTTEWWENRRTHFDLFISEFVLAEAALGDPAAAQKRLDILRGISVLDSTDAVRALGSALIAQGPIPPRAAIDALHIAIAAVNGMEYLLTWNCSHIANAVMRPRIEEVCRTEGYEPPVICTPLELMEE
jgi:predicted nucleic acid-binding protein